MSKWYNRHGSPRHVRQVRTFGDSAFGYAVAASLVTEVSAFLERVEDDRVWKQFKTLTGSVAVANGGATLSTGTTQFAYMTAQTVQQQSYEPGKGIRALWTAAFPDGPVSGAFQAAGPFHGESGFAVGYPPDGSGFSFLFRRGRRYEIQALQITAAASGAETVTVTLNGTVHAVPVTAGTVQQNAKEIAEFSSGYTDSGGFVPYDVYSLDDTVYFIRQADGAVVGSYTISSTGTLTGSYTQFQAGESGTQTWVEKSDWSIDPCDGGGPSGITLDPSSMTVYGITWGWLGALGCMLWVQDPNDQEMIPVHYQPWGGTSDAVEPTVEDPRYPIIYAVASLGSTTNVRVRGGSCFLAQEGDERVFGPAFATTVTSGSIGTTEIPIVSAMTAPVDLRRGGFNRRVGTLEDLVASNVGSKDAIVRVYVGEQANLVGSVFQSSDPDSIAWLDTSATAVTGTLDQISSVNVPAGQAVRVWTPKGGRKLYRGQVLIVTAQTTASTTTIAVSINGYEDL